ncbi:MAG: GlcG/HbpS family heme-binding protein [Sphingomonadaceae bacterium]
MSHSASRFTLALTRQALSAAMARAAEEGCPVCITVLDITGQPVMLERADQASPASTDIALAKARCSLMYRLPTSALGQAASANAAMASLPHMLPFAGGIPVIKGQECIGAIGVSGGSERQDELIAHVALDILVK